MTVSPLVDAARRDELPAVVLVEGDRVLAEPVAERLAKEIGQLWGVEPRLARHPEDAGELAADLRTLSLFDAGKIVIAVETGWLADKDASVKLLAQALEALPLSGDDELSGRERDAARRLLQVLRLHGIDPEAGEPGEVLASLPAPAFGTGASKLGAVGEVRAELEPLLVAARTTGLRGAGESERGLVADLVRDGLPPRHLLILVESSVAAKEPLAAQLERAGGRVDAGRLAAGRKGAVDGLDRLVAELERETGVGMRRDATAELSRRTLRGEDVRRGGSQGAIDADSSTRFAAEYRKLAGLTDGTTIDRGLVERNVEDRGEEDVWAILDAIGEGKPQVALAGIRRRVAAADDPLAERLSLFALLAGYAKNLVAVGGALSLTGARRGEPSYPRFKERVAPALQGELPELEVNPIAKLHPYRLHRSYLAASRFDAARLPALLAKVLETERALKGDSSEPDAALATFVAELAGGVSRDPGGRAGSRARAASGERR